MNNKKLGTDFERFMCDFLAGLGYWVHFINPDQRGSQPFDLIAVKDDHAICGDCKTCKSHIFNIGRLEDNQISAFEKWIKRGNSDPIIFVLHNNRIYFISYARLKHYNKVDLSEEGTYVSIGKQ